MKNTLAILVVTTVLGLFWFTGIGADGTLVNSNGTTTVGGSVSPGNYLTNNQSTEVTFGSTVVFQAGSAFAPSIRSAAVATSGLYFENDSSVGIGANKTIINFGIGDGIGIPNTIVFGWFTNGTTTFKEQRIGAKFSTIANVISGDRTILVSSNFVAEGALTATNGHRSFARTQLAPVAITVGASPFNFTNSAASNGSGTNNIQVFIDGVSVTGTVGINGTTIFNTIGQNTIGLQPGEWCTITYTVGTPTALWKPF